MQKRKKERKKVEWKSAIEKTTDDGHGDQHLS